MAKESTEKLIRDLDKKVDRKFEKMEDTFTNFRHELRKELQPVRDFYITKAGSGDLTKDLIKIILALISLVGVIVGGSRLL